MSTYYERFYEILIRQSRSKVFNEVITEWEFKYMYEGEVEDNKHCICGHFIKYSYVIVNILNGNTLELGSECIKKIPGDLFEVCKKVKSAYKKIEQGKIEKLNKKQIDIMYEFGYLNSTDLPLFTLNKYCPTNAKIELDKIANRIQNKVNPKIPLIIEEPPPPPYVEEPLNTTYNIGDKLSLIDYEYLKEVPMLQKNKDFIENIYKYKHNLSEKQLKWLNNIISTNKKIDF